MINPKKRLQIKKAGPFFFDKGSKTGVLLLHGFTSTPYQFRELGKYLAERGLTVYAPLVAGHGTCPEDLKNTCAEDWKKSVEEAYRFLKSKTENIVIIGNSFGGNLAFYLARKTNNDPKAIISLSAPIKLTFGWFIKLRLYLYGWMKEYYRKATKIYQIDYTDMIDEVTYPLIPIKSLRDFLSFVKEETIPNLKEVKAPILIVYASNDLVVSPKSARFIYENVRSLNKEIFELKTNHHVILTDKKKEELFKKTYDLIKKAASAA